MPSSGMRPGSSGTWRGRSHRPRTLRACAPEEGDRQQHSRRAANPCRRLVRDSTSSARPARGSTARTQRGRRSGEICRQESWRARGTGAQPEDSPDGSASIGCFNSCLARVHTEQLGKNTEAERGHGDVYNTEEKDTDGIVFLLIFFFFWRKCQSWGAGGTVLGWFQAWGSETRPHLQFFDALRNLLLNLQK
jgi:hypothetical protein